MDLLKSKKLASFRAHYFEHAKRHLLFKNIEDTDGNIVFGKGSDSPRVVFIGEAPGQQENKNGLPFVGRSGKLLDKWIKELNLEKKDYAVINVVPIIPLKNGKIRKPTNEEINYFLPMTHKYLELLNPKIIVLLGRSAASVFNKNLKLGEIKNWVKNKNKNSSFLENKKNALSNTKAFFIYHPSYYLRRGGKGFELTISKLDDFLKNKSKQLNLKKF